MNRIGIGLSLFLLAVVGFVAVENRSKLRQSGIAPTFKESNVTEMTYTPVQTSGTSPLDWLDGRPTERAVAWIRGQRKRIELVLQNDPRYARYQKLALQVLESNNSDLRAQRMSQIQGEWVFDVHRDGLHPRGIWRRTHLESYLKSEPTWHDLLDIDKLSATEGANWVFKGAHCLLPEASRCLLFFSTDETPAVTIREYDTNRRAFVEGGFNIPHAISIVTWHDQNSVLIATSLDAESRSSIGQPLAIRLWKRGQPLSAASKVFRAESDALLVFPVVFADEHGTRLEIVTQIDSKNGYSYWRLDEQMRPARMTLPVGSRIFCTYNGQLIFSLRESGWSTQGRDWPQGSLLSTSVEGLRKKTPLDVRPVLEFGPRDALLDVNTTTRGLLVTSYSNVRGRLWRVTFDGTAWRSKQIHLPDNGSIVVTMSSPSSGFAFAEFQNFLQPPTVYLIDVGGTQAKAVSEPAAQFDASRYTVEQFAAESKDGTLVPYFVVRPKRQADGRLPVLLYAYGAAGSIETPSYSGILGKLWLDQGGGYVLANIRGGGEFGAAWRTSKTQRRQTYDDLIAVAEDLIRRNITSPQHLGIRGHSKGGLLIGVVLTERPDLFNAAVIENPALDPLNWFTYVNGRRFKFVDPELGSPDVPEERTFLEQTSPIRNLHRHTKLPVPFIATSTTDDLVPPEMARRFAIEMERRDMPFFFWESPASGHGPCSGIQECAVYNAVLYTYLARQLMETHPKGPQ